MRALLMMICSAALGQVYPPVVICQSFTVSYSNAAFKADSASATIALMALRQRQVVIGTYIKHADMWHDGDGDLAGVTVSLGSSAGGATAYSVAHQMGDTGAPSDTNMLLTSQFKRATTANETINAYFASTGRNFGDGQATYMSSGSVLIGICTVRIP